MLQPRYIVAAGFLLAAVAGWWWIWLPVKKPQPPAGQSQAAVVAPEAAAPVAQGAPLVHLPNVGKPRELPPVAADDPRHALNTAVPEFVRLVEAQDYLALIRNFSPPDEQARLSRAMSLENLASQISRQPEVVAGFSQLATALRAMPEGAAQINEAGDAATFPLNPSVRGKDSVTFIRVGGLWYLQN